LNEQKGAGDSGEVFEEAATRIKHNHLTSGFANDLSEYPAIWVICGNSRNPIDLLF